jgi:hypothetical protein
MRITSLGFVASVILAVSGCGGFSYEFSISSETIQSGLDEYFPMETSVDLPKRDAQVNVILSDVAVILKDGSDELGLTATINAELPEVDFPKRELPTAPPAPGPPGIRPEPPADSQLAARTVVGTVSVFGNVSYDAEAGEFFFLNPKIRKFEVDNLPAKREDLIRRAAERLLGKYLSKHSIYKLDDGDLKNRAAKAVLKSINVRDGQLRIKIGI